MISELSSTDNAAAFNAEACSDVRDEFIGARGHTTFPFPIPLRIGLSPPSAWPGRR